MNWLQLGGSIVAILFLAGIAWALGLGRTEIGDEAEAMQAAEDALSGFEPVRAIVSADKSSAMVEGKDGSVAALKLHGAQIAVRGIDASQVIETPEGWTLDSGERRFGRVIVRR
ncbi:hypothetical protein [Sphingomonas soli]|uniref:hypothetical protein n=1 Tax=Sphingomonas soli TaxID=266127 RepID=UPI00082BB0F9|nr:hypothetical protein [Sphingomonas soli]